MSEIEMILKNLLNRYPVLEVCRDAIMDSYQILERCCLDDKIIYTCGNGGSAADAEHIVGELLKGFLRKRPMSRELAEKFCSADDEDGALLSSRLQCGIRSFCLMSQTAIGTAVSNDLGGDLPAAQQLFALGRPGDVLLGISTSGNARNIELAVKVARQLGIKVIGMTGAGGGKLGRNADICIRVPETETYKIQELHLPVYHALCQMLEARFFEK